MKLLIVACLLSVACFAQTRAPHAFDQPKAHGFSNLQMVRRVQHVRNALINDVALAAIGHDNSADLAERCTEANLLYTEISARLHTPADPTVSFSPSDMSDIRKRTDVLVQLAGKLPQ